MTSDRKVAANRRNAQKSTGPRTLSGKTIASMNALKHGLCSRKPLIPGENEAEFAQFTADWVDDQQPTGPHQSLLVEQIIMAAWQLKRVPQLEAGLLTRYMKKDENPFSLPPEAYQQLSRLDRHQACLQKTLERAMKELKELQAADYADEADQAEEQNEPTVPQALCSPELGDATVGPSERPDWTAPRPSPAA